MSRYVCTCVRVCVCVCVCVSSPNPLCQAWGNDRIVCAGLETVEIYAVVPDASSSSSSSSSSSTTSTTTSSSSSSSFSSAPFSLELVHVPEHRGACYCTHP